MKSTGPAENAGSTGCADKSRAQERKFRIPATAAGSNRETNMTIVIKEMQVRATVEKSLSSGNAVTPEMLERMRDELKRELLRTLRKELDIRSANPRER